MSKKGCDIIIVGVFGNKPEISMAMVQDKEFCIIGSLMYIEQDYDDAIQLLESGEINTRNLITKEFIFDELPNTYKYIENNSDDSMKILVKVG